MSSKFHSSKSSSQALTAGIIISILVPIFLIFYNTDAITSLLIGLVGLSVTLLYDLHKRMPRDFNDLHSHLQQDKEEIIDLLKLEKDLFEDDWLLDIVSQIIDDSQRVKENKYEAFIERRNMALIDCRNTIHGLSEGFLDTDIYSEYSFGVLGIKQAAKSIKAVQYADPIYWREQYGDDYLQSNMKAIERKVKLTRVWIQSRETLIDIQDIINKQQEMGVEVFVSEPEGIPLQLLSDYVIMDDLLFVKLDLTSDGKGRLERHSIDEIEVAKANERFNRLLKYVIPASQYYEGNKKNSTANNVEE